MLEYRQSQVSNESLPSTVDEHFIQLDFFLGIPDYRSAGVGLYARTNHKPIQFIEFLKSAKVRQRYWARNYVGWPRFSSIEPNIAHHTLAKWERQGRINAIVTQNVDTLHSKAGSKNVIEIHGNAYSVKCLSCTYTISRHNFQDILSTLNPSTVDHSTMIRPDGDVEMAQEYVDNFKVPDCPECGGNLKPEIIFFGDNVPQDRIKTVASLICSSDALLVLGSSLLVYSGYRIVLHCFDLRIPIAIVNIGGTRGDDKADLKISTKCGDLLPKIFQYKSK